MELFGDVAPFLQTNTDLSPTTRTKLLAVLDNLQQKAYIQVELAITPFVRATYDLEGDSPLALKCYEIISTLTTAVQQGHYTNLQALATQILSRNVQVHQQWVQ